jgi:hypothetical protein
MHVETATFGGERVLVCIFALDEAKIELESVMRRQYRCNVKHGDAYLYLNQYRQKLETNIIKLEKEC